jgi:N,N'-diacetyllegionaminate synthase
MSYYFYTETAFHHEGDVRYLKELIDASASVGAQGVKFQVLIDYDELLSTKHPAYHTFKKALLSKESWNEVLTYCTAKGLDIIFMPCDVMALKLVSEGHIRPAFLDIHSVSFYDTNVLASIRETGIPIILGIGGRYPQEISEKIEFFGEQLKVLMIGYQSFPTEIENLIIEKIQFFGKKYPQIKIGYADHSSVGSADSIQSNEWAYLLGARFFEKHITLHPKVEMFDWQSASSKEDIAVIIKKLNRLDLQVMNKSTEEIQGLTNLELAYRNREKVALAATHLVKGTVISNENLIFKMSGVEGGVGRANEIVGKKLLVDKEPDDVISLKDLAE